MRTKASDDYSPVHLSKLKYVLADIYEAFGSISENLYLVGGLVPDLLVSNKLSYLKEYLGTLDIDLAIKFVVSQRGKYKDFYKIIRSLGFEKQKTSDGLDVMNHSFIKYEGGYKPIVIDFITDDKFAPVADKLKEIAPGVDAVKFRGVYLVFNDFIVRDLIRNRKRLYLDFLKSKAPDLDLNGLKIVIDCAYGALSNIAPLLFRELGAEVYSLNDQPNGANINLNCGALCPQNLAKLVTQYNADIGFSFDGDGDRVILADENGNLLDGDYIMVIMALALMQKKQLPHNTIVTTTMSNYGLREAIENAGAKLIQTDVGDRNVTEALIKNNLMLGGEQSGHIIFLNHSSTGDALITCLEMLKVMREKNKQLSELAQCMRKFPQVLVNVEVKEKKPFEYIPQIQETISRSESRLNGNGRLLVRYSGTEPVARIMVEGKDQNLIEEIADSLAVQIKQEIGVENA